MRWFLLFLVGGMPALAFGEDPDELLGENQEVPVLGEERSDFLLPGRERRMGRRQAVSEEYPELSLKLENPLARILVVPLRFEYQDGPGSGDNGDQFAIRLAPRVPFVLNENWHIISRSSIEWVSKRRLSGDGGVEGLTDLAQSFFLSPDRSLGWDVYWGVGPSFILPTATNSELGSDLVSVGPSFGLFRQTRPWTAGLILNHLNSVAGSSSLGSINLSGINPLIGYTTKLSTTYSIGGSFLYDWRSDQWAGPLEVSVSQLTLIRKRPVQWRLGVQYHIFSEPNAPDWGAFFQVTLPLRSPRWGSRD